MIHAIYSLNIIVIIIIIIIVVVVVLIIFSFHIIGLQYLVWCCLVVLYCQMVQLRHQPALANGTMLTSQTLTPWC